MGYNVYNVPQPNSAEEGDSSFGCLVLFSSYVQETVDDGGKRNERNKRNEGSEYYPKTDQHLRLFRWRYNLA